MLLNQDEDQVADLSIALCSNLKFLIRSGQGRAWDSGKMKNILDDIAFSCWPAGGWREVEVALQRGGAVAG